MTSKVLNFWKKLAVGIPQSASNHMNAQHVGEKKNGCITLQAKEEIVLVLILRIN